MRSYQLIPTKRKTTLIYVFLVLIILLSFRYVDLQILNFGKYQDRANANSIRQIILNAPRGIIFDRKGIPLVENRPTYDLMLIPVDVTDHFDYDLLSKKTDIPPAELQRVVDEEKRSINRFRPKLIKRHINFEVMSNLEEHKLSLPGIIFTENPARTYVSDCNLSHTLGYLRIVSENVLRQAPLNLNYTLDDVYGAAGMEKTYEPLLRGNNGLEYHRVDIYSRDHGVVRDEDRYPPISGQSLQITIDSKLQAYVESRISGHRGAVIVMDPTTGEILVFTSSPDYSLNTFVGPIPSELWNSLNKSPDRPLVNRGSNGLYPPGSTFKLIAASLIMESDLINPYYNVQCNGSYTLGDRVFRCWNTAGHGQVNLKTAIKYSCNIYFYRAIQGLIFSEWSDMASRYGFGKKTGIDLPYEAEGIIPTEAYLNEKYTRRGWSIGNLLSFVIGQGDVLATPLQVIQMVNLISTNGHTYQPHLNIFAEKVPLNLQLKLKTWTFLQDAMFDVVNAPDGTGKNAKIQTNGTVRGKTGTSQNPHGDPHSSFLGYLTTSEGDTFTLYVLIENGGKGSGIAASIAKDIFTYLDATHTTIAVND